MIIRTAIFCSTFVSALLLILAPVAQSRDLYRYYNAEGNVVVDYRVPVEYVSAGYEVLNEEGVVIKVIPRKLTKDERLVMDAQQKLEEQTRIEQERLRKWDESLLMRYSTVADIEDTRERALRDLRIRVSILKGNKRALKQKVENYQAQAANLERSGSEVGVERLRVIDELQGEIGATDRAITDREVEIEEVAAVYQADIERFEMLHEAVELRRTLLARDHEAMKRPADPRR